MKTKHFLITTAAGENVAVIGASSDREFRSKIDLSIRQQFCDESIVSSEPLIKMDLCNNKREIHVAGFECQFTIVFIQRIELY